MNHINCKIGDFEHHVREIQGTSLPNPVKHATHVQVLDGADKFEDSNEFIMTGTWDLGNQPGMGNINQLKEGGTVMMYDNGAKAISFNVQNRPNEKRGQIHYRDLQTLEATYCEIFEDRVRMGYQAPNNGQDYNVVVSAEGIRFEGLPYYEDDQDAISNGALPGITYITNGNGAGPAGIMRIVQ